ncbi:allantoate amidohydrolase [Actinidia rufa]|uniref:allantoate deiminase n=1 Tax=Actinidia rufa TaxID=165716 RepID=A0A7J0G7I2_9ERIC|nr:allantoate amidohydrolase [Actinidia rufa]
MMAMPLVQKFGNNLAFLPTLKVTVRGSQGHAGTVPMTMRQDPMAAAAELIMLLEGLCKHPDEYLSYDGQCKGFTVESLAGSLVCTVGEISCWPSASNVIPGEASTKISSFTVDIRAMDDMGRKAIIYELSNQMHIICDRRSVSCIIECKHDANAVACDTELSSQLESATYTTMKRMAGEVLDDVPVLMSGAGHDAMAMSHLTKVGMLFVRCRGGVSHSPAEHVLDDDVWAAGHIRREDELMAELIHAPILDNEGGGSLHLRLLQLHQQLLSLPPLFSPFPFASRRKKDKLDMGLSIGLGFFLGLGFHLSWIQQSPPPAHWRTASEIPCPHHRATSLPTEVNALPYLSVCTFSLRCPALPYRRAPQSTSLCKSSWLPLSSLVYTFGEITATNQIESERDSFGDVAPVDTSALVSKHLLALLYHSGSSRCPCACFACLCAPVTSLVHSSFLYHWTHVGQQFFLSGHSPLVDIVLLSSFPATSLCFP